MDGIVQVPMGGIPFKTSDVSEVLKYWLPASYEGIGDRVAEDVAADFAEDLKKAIVERRASKILLWDENGLNFPLNQDLAGQYLQESETAIKTVFGRLIKFLGSLWLAPERLEDDGSAQALSQIILSYNELSGTLDKIPCSDRILFCAESLQQAKTGTWHARLAQALSFDREYQEAILEFQNALRKGVEGSWIVNAGLAHAYSHLNRYYLAVECLEASTAQRRSTDSVHSGRDLELRLATEMISKAHWLDEQGLTELAVQAAIEAYSTCNRQNINPREVWDFCLGFFTKHRRETELLLLVKKLQTGWIGFPRSWYLAARFNADHESFDACICRLFDRALSQLMACPCSHVIDTLFYAAMFHSEHGRTDRAIQLWEKLLGIDIDENDIGSFCYWPYRRKIAWREVGLHHFLSASNKGRAASEATGDIKTLEKLAPILAVSENYRHDTASDEMILLSLIESNVHRVDGEVEESRKCLRAQVAQNLRFVSQSRGTPVQRSMKLLGHFAIWVHALFKLLQVFLFARDENDRSLIATLVLLKLGSIEFYHLAGADLDYPLSLISGKLATDHKIKTSRVKFEKSASKVLVAQELRLKSQDPEDGQESNADAISFARLASATSLGLASASEAHDHSYVAKDETGFIQRVCTPHSHPTFSPYTLDTYGITWHWDQVSSGPCSKPLRCLTHIEVRQNKDCVCFKQPSDDVLMRPLHYHTKLLFERDLQRVVDAFAPYRWRPGNRLRRAKPEGYYPEYPSSEKESDASMSEDASSDSGSSILPGRACFRNEKADTTHVSGGENQGPGYQSSGNDLMTANRLVESTERRSSSDIENDEAAKQRAASHEASAWSGKVQDQGELQHAQSKTEAAGDRFKSEQPEELHNPVDRPEWSCAGHECPQFEDHPEFEIFDSENIFTNNDDVYMKYQTLKDDDIDNVTHDEEYPFGFRCVGCSIRRNSYSDWHLCRICPYTALCRKCFSRLRSGTLVRTVCGKDHEFFDTGPPLIRNEVPIATHITDQTVPYDGEWIPLSDWVEKVRLEWDLSMEELASGCLRESETC